jgi:CRP-like cAMP-binding protein
MVSMSIGLIVLLAGFISAVSLPIGSIVGLSAKPKARINSAFMAFGAGALLFALTIEIVAHSFHLVGFWPLALGCVIGGILYELLNHGLDFMGAFFRKSATVIRQLTRLKIKKAERVLKHLSRVDILQSMPPEDIAKLVPLVEERVLEENTIIFKENSPAEAVYIIDSGAVEIVKDGKPIARGGPGDTFGEMALLTNVPRIASAVTRERTKIFQISKKDFNDLLRVSPKLKKAVEELLIKRGAELSRRSTVSGQIAKKWREQALSALKSQDFAPTTLEISQAAQAHGAAGMGIWLGNLLDAIPESLVIGLAASREMAIPWTLVAGVFLANVPEALSSSVVMRNQKYSGTKILLMWSFITIMMTAGALAGNMFLQNLHAAGIAMLEGMVVGAMLTMIAETMLPEAFEQGGAVVGLSTLAGFLTALFVKSISQ